MPSERILLGGLVAGLVMNENDFVTNVPVFGASWAAAYARFSARERSSSARRSAAD